MKSGDEAVVRSIDRKLSVVIQLLAYGIVRDKTVSEGAPVLKRFGLTADEIASVFDSTAKAVGVRVAEAKRKSAKQRKK